MQIEVMRTIDLSAYGLCTIASAASSKRVSVATVRRWVKAGRLHVLVVGAGKREVWLLDANEVGDFRAPQKGRAGPMERERRRRLELQARRCALVSANLTWTRKRAATEDRNVLALARRIRDGDESARIGLIDRLKELGRDGEAERVRRHVASALRALIGDGSAALRPTD